MTNERLTIEQEIDKAYDTLFAKICDEHDDLYELKIVYKEETTGKTIVRSWRERNKILAEKELDSIKWHKERERKI